VTRFAPIAALRTLFGFPVRNLEAAGGGRRWHGRPAQADTRSVIHGGAVVTAARAAHYAMNNPHGARMVETLTANVIGTGIKPVSLTPDEALRERLHRAFLAWTDRADAAELCDFYAVQAQAVRDMVTLGEAVLVWTQAADGTPQLIRLHPEQLDRSYTREIDGSRYAVQGVEFDRGTGRRIAYHIRRGTGMGVGGLALDSLGGIAPAERFPAEAVIHMFRPLVPGQVRGLSWYAPVLLSGQELDKLTDALLVRAQVAALHAGFIYDADGSGPSYQGTQTGSELDVVLEPGTMSVLGPGKRVEWSEPPDSGDAPALATHTLRAMAAGVGISYEQLTGDYSQVTYSSSRAALLEFRRFCEAVQHHVVVYQLCRPVWQRFMRWQVMSGSVSAQAFLNPDASLQTAKWLPPSWPWVDPQKDARAAIMEMEANIRSRSDIIAERGYDAEEIDRQIAADRARASRLGIAPDAQEPPANAA
jgi:lambda family phage portal protein